MRVNKSYSRVSEGSLDFGVRDLKGRMVGYHWSIKAVTYSLAGEGMAAYIVPDDSPMNMFELNTSPTRDGKRYGPSFNSATVASVADAEVVLAGRIKNARKATIKKFGEVKP